MTGVVEPNGTSIVDVTDPTPPALSQTSSPAARESARLAALKWCGPVTRSDFHANRRTKTGRYYLLRATANGHEVYDVTDPSNPKLVISIISNLGRHTQELLGM